MQVHVQMLGDREGQKVSLSHLTQIISDIPMTETYYVPCPEFESHHCIGRFPG